MNCQQKSGVFLNLDCQNTKAHTCTNCKKDVCETHAHVLMTNTLCEDCYWETYLFSIEKEDIYVEGSYIDTDIGGSSTSQSSPSPSGFDGGFGGGDFGGGGASGAWTKGDMQSLSDTSTNDNLGMLGTDDTFFYS